MFIRSSVVVSLLFLLALLLQQESCIHPSAQLQTRVQHDVCTHECLSTELLSYGSERQENKGMPDKEAWKFAILIPSILFLLWRVSGSRWSHKLYTSYFRYMSFILFVHALFKTQLIENSARKWILHFLVRYKIFNQDEHFTA